MGIRFVITVFVWLRIGLIFLGCSLLFSYKIHGESYFSSVLSDDVLKNAVKNATDVNARNSDQMTGLMFAAQKGMLSLAKYLFEAGADLDLVNPLNQYTALHYSIMPAAQMRSVGEYLVDSFANTMLKNNLGYTPLHCTNVITTPSDRSAMIAMLVKNGCDINAQNNDGNTLLHMAVQFKDKYFVVSLLDEWGSILDLSIKNKLGYTPQEFANSLGFYELSNAFLNVKKITDAGVYDPHGLSGFILAIIRGDENSVRKMVQKNVVNSVSRDEYADTPLHFAMVYQNTPIIRLLLDNGADRIRKNSYGDTPIHYLVRIHDHNERMNVAKLLIGNDYSAINISNNNGNTLLHMLVQYNDPQLLRYILDTYGSKINLKANKELKRAARDYQKNILRSGRRCHSPFWVEMFCLFFYKQWLENMMILNIVINYSSSTLSIM